MSDRQVVNTRFLIAGRPVKINLIHNPLVDDLLITEAQIQAYAIEHKVDISTRRIPRDIRDFLIRLNVER